MDLEVVSKLSPRPHRHRLVERLEASSLPPAWVQFAPPLYITNTNTIQSNTVRAADEEMRDVIEEVEEVEREGLAPDDDFAEADASAGESDDEEVQEEFVDDDDDVEVRCKRLWPL